GDGGGGADGGAAVMDDDGLPVVGAEGGPGAGDGLDAGGPAGGEQRGEGAAVHARGGTLLEGQEQAADDGHGPEEGDPHDVGALRRRERAGAAPPGGTRGA